MTAFDFSMILPFANFWHLCSLVIWNTYYRLTLYRHLHDTRGARTQALCS